MYLVTKANPLIFAKELYRQCQSIYEAMSFFHLSAYTCLLFKTSHYASFQPLNIFSCCCARRPFCVIFYKCKELMRQKNCSKKFQPSTATVFFVCVYEMTSEHHFVLCMKMTTLAFITRFMVLAFMARVLQKLKMSNRFYKALDLAFFPV